MVITDLETTNFIALGWFLMNYCPHLESLYISFQFFFYKNMQVLIWKERMGAVACVYGHVHILSKGSVKFVISF